MQVPMEHSRFDKERTAFTGHLGKMLAALSPDIRRDMLDHADFRTVPAGTILIEPGQPSTEIGYVIEGTLGMIQDVHDGRRQIIGLLVPTDLFGRLFDGPASYRVEAMTDANLCCFDRGYFEQVLLQQPSAEQMFVVHMLDELDAAREWLQLIGERKILHRTAAFLAVLARRIQSGATPAPVAVSLPLARKDLAHYLGTRPESLSRAFHKLKDLGLVEIIDPSHFEIPDLAALNDLVDDDFAI